jgi:hypothetical protein
MSVQDKQLANAWTFGENRADWPPRSEMAISERHAS